MRRNKMQENLDKGNNKNPRPVDNMFKSTEKEIPKRTRPFIKEGGYTQRAYYITEEQYTDIKLLSVYRDSDTSSIVREALENYIEKHKNELNK